MKEKYNKIVELVKKDVNQSEKFIDDIFYSEKEISDIFIKNKSEFSKKLRIVITLLAIKAIGLEITEKDLYVTTATELVHQASLIHDDVIDEDFIRHNKPTINAIYGAKTAVLSGDYLLSQAVKFLVKIDKIEIVEDFFDTISLLCSTEIQQHLQKGEIITIEDYIKKSRNKTAVLFSLPIKSILKIKNANPKIIIEMENFAINFGIAYQIKNDLKDFMKENSSDKKNKIYTAPFIYKERGQDPIEMTKLLVKDYTEKTKRNLSFICDNLYKEALIEICELNYEF